MSSNKKYKTAQEIAPRYLTTPAQIYEWVRSGVIPPGCVIRLGRKVLFDEDALDAWDARGGSTQTLSIDSKNDAPAIA